MAARAIWAARTLFLLALSIVALAMAALSHVLLKRSEIHLAEAQFRSIASRATLAASHIVERKLRGAKLLASVIAHSHSSPAAATTTTNDWPFVTVDGFEEIASNLMDTIDGREVAFAPFVEPAEVSAFESFAYEHFNTSFGPGVGDSWFGPGMWGTNISSSSAAGGQEQRYHDNRVERTPNDFFAPIFHHSGGASSILMFNLRSEERRRRALDALLDCSRRPGSLSCSEITDVVTLTTQHATTTPDLSPSALLLEPVGLGSNLTGVVVSTLVWEELFENVFSDEVSGIRCVLESDHQSFTYEIERGVASLVSSSTADPASDDAHIVIEKIVHLTPSELFDPQSPQYTLSLYPTESFFDVYSTVNPRLAAFGSFVLIAITSLVFMVYDYFVRKEFTNKKELLEAKRQFMRWVCHEVRTPLNSLCLGLTIICTEMLNTVQRSPGGEKGGKGCVIRNEKVSEWLDLASEVRCSANIAVDVLSDVLNYDKIERGELSLELSIFRLSNLVEETAREFRLSAVGKNIDFTVNATDDSMSTICGDRIRLAQALRNLLSNGLKFTPENGSLTISVETELFPHPKPQQNFQLHTGTEVSMDSVGFTLVKVTDSGPGLSVDQIAKLFRDGVQFNVNDLQGGKGTGLGLCISKGIVDKHGGEMWVESEGIGRGTTFLMKIPAFGIDESTESTNASCSDIASSSPQLENDGKDPCRTPASNPLHILVVDDALSNRKLLMRMLSNMGHRCEGAENGALAVEKVQQTIDTDPFDCILLDFEMPVMNGPAASAEIRSIGCNCCIIGITGNVLAEDIEFFQKMGANDVLPKPLHMPDLHALWSDYGLL